MKTGLLWKEWRQHAWVLITLFILVVGFGQLNTYNTIADHQKNLRYFESSAFKAEQKKSPVDERMSEADIINNLTVYDDALGLSFLVAFIFCVFIGLKTTAFEKNKGADYIAQAMPYSRTTIIAHKLIWPTLTIFVSLFLYRGLSYWQLSTQIDAVFITAFKEYCLQSLTMLLLMLLCYTISLMIGTLVGDALVASLVTIAILYSASLLFYYNLVHIIQAFLSFTTNKTMEQIQNTTFQSTLFGFSHWDMIILMLLIIMFASLAIVFYSKASLENNGLFLMLPKMRFPVILIGALYTAICLARIDYEERITAANLLGYGLNAGLIILISGFIGWLCFYKLKKLRRL
ncbi:hypothetical protein [Brochothrix campestris]|uniref:ABC transporter permease n=1 Tax=Brochothrix campestris FSL F6-1037 TaxID=1265861 RepID=W7CHY5_9LIST|nr:hypothetical protein [Brochothrix campestris]EUJ38994.1 hypothetical protein BCAMP_08295 [Brochothrix campestris FSL F6-1037]